MGSPKSLRSSDFIDSSAGDFDALVIQFRHAIAGTQHLAEAIAARAMIPGCRLPCQMAPMAPF